MDPGSDPLADVATEPQVQCPDRLGGVDDSGTAVVFVLDDGPSS